MGRSLHRRRSARSKSRRPPGVVLLALALSLGAFLLLVYGMSARGSGNQTLDSALSEGRAVQAPSIQLEVLRRPEGEGSHLGRRASADGRLNLRELRGEPVVVNFWASWCDPCRNEMPLLSRGARRASEPEFVGVNMQDVKSDARRFLDRNRVGYLNVRDPTDETARRWGTRGIPETFFVDSGGRIVAHAIGEISQRQLERGIAAAESGDAIDLSREP